MIKKITNWIWPPTTSPNLKQTLKTTVISVFEEIVIVVVEERLAVDEGTLGAAHASEASHTTTTKAILIGYEAIPLESQTTAVNARSQNGLGGRDLVTCDAAAQGDGAYA